jgi:dipeptide transport system substrate-binding protein
VVQFNALVKKAKQTADVGERTKLYEQAQVVFKREAPWATIDHSTEFVPMSSKVSGFVQDPVGVHRFDGVDIAE